MSEPKSSYDKQKDALNSLFENFGIKIDDWRKVTIEHELENKKEMFLFITRVQSKEPDKSR
jgi:hypothetical protein